MPVRFGVIGLGRGQGLVSIARAVGGIEITAVHDIDTARAATVAGQIGARCFDDYAAFLASDIDVVVVASPVPNHAEHAISALAAGKHVLSEVTACSNEAEARSLVEAGPGHARRLHDGRELPLPGRGRAGPPAACGGAVRRALLRRGRIPPRLPWPLVHARGRAHLARARRPGRLLHPQPGAGALHHRWPHHPRQRQGRARRALRPSRRRPHHAPDADGQHHRRHRACAGRPHLPAATPDGLLLGAGDPRLLRGPAGLRRRRQGLDGRRAPAVAVPAPPRSGTRSRDAHGHPGAAGAPRRRAWAATAPASTGSSRSSWPCSAARSNAPSTSIGRSTIRSPGSPPWSPRRWAEPRSSCPTPGVVGVAPEPLREIEPGFAGTAGVARRDITPTGRHLRP